MLHVLRVNYFAFQILEHTNNVFELKSYKSLKRPGCPFQELAKEVLKKEKEQEKVLNAVSPTDTISDDGLDGEGKQTKPLIFIHVYRSLLTVPRPFSNQGLSRLQCNFALVCDA